MSFQKLLKKNNLKIRAFVKTYYWQILIFASMFLALTLILTFDFFSSKHELVVGQIAEEDLVAQKTIEYTDKFKTADLEKKAVDAVESIYVFQPDTVTQVHHDIQSIFSMIDKVNGLEASTDEKEALLRKQLAIKLSDKSLKLAVSLDKDEIANLQDLVIKTNDDVLDTGVKQEKITKAIEEIESLVSLHNLSSAKRDFVIEVARKTLKPNFVIDQIKTDSLKEEARDSVTPVTTMIPRGLVIVRKGDMITEENLAILEAIGLQKSRVRINDILGAFIFNIIVMCALIIYLFRYTPEVLFQKNKLILLCMIIIVCTFINKVICDSDWADYGEGVGIVAAGCMIVSIMLDQRLAILVSGMLALNVGIVDSYGLDTVVIAFMSGITGIYSIYKINRRSELTRVFFKIAMINVILIIMICLMQDIELEEILRSCVAGTLYAFLSAILTIGLLPFLESTFKITTFLTLLDIGNPNEPLLKRLMMETPGTYQHSIIVANLAESAAECVGADYILARVGSYYHDIGKLNRPCFFIENQLSQDNPHDNTLPDASAAIIISHVRDGILLAREHNLPDNIQDIIRQHHGTTLVSYFYHKAAEKNENVMESEFRYLGPKPQTREAAIVMLADAVEAAVRSIRDMNHEKMEAMVRKIINSKMNTGELDECSLTFRDLETIARAFVRSLGGIHHSRIEYPEEKKK